MPYCLIRILVYANAAQTAKITENTATSSSIRGENEGEPNRKERIRSEPFVSGLIWANLTNGVKPLVSSVWIIAIG